MCDKLSPFSLFRFRLRGPSHFHDRMRLHTVNITIASMSKYGFFFVDCCFLKKHVLVFLVKLVEEFKEHTEGSNPIQKTRWNARRRANHVIYFLRFMSEPALPHLNLLFLKDYGRIRT